jgi:hypothetical protein
MNTPNQESRTEGDGRISRGVQRFVAIAGF